MQHNHANLSDIHFLYGTDATTKQELRQKTDMWPHSTWNLLSMQRKKQHKQIITTQQCTSPGTTCSKQDFAVGLSLKQMVNAIEGLHKGIEKPAP